MGKCQATPTKNQKNTVTLCSPLVGLESSLYYYVTRSHHLHLVHHKWTDVIEEGAVGPLDSLLRLNQVVGESRVGAQDGDCHSLHTHTHRDIFVEPYIIHLIYRKYIYLYYTQAVTLREGPGHPDKGCGHQGMASVTSRGSAGRRMDKSILPQTLGRGAPPLCSLENQRGLGPRLGAPEG